jgi:hypothetical protein
MNPLASAALDWGRLFGRAWDRFWFTPQQPHTLALVRILGGAMLLYTHLVWTIELENFFGPQAWLNAEAVSLMSQMPQQAGSTAWSHANYAWSYLYYCGSPAVLWTVHLAGLVVFALLTIGLWSRVVSILACVITLAYCNRATGAWFGLDQINALIAMYLMIGSCGGAYSVDRWLAARRGAAGPPARIDTNIAVRLIQLHMCVIYLFGGISKMRGLTWWDGSAMWLAVASLEYQSLDLTWLVEYRWLLALLTHITVFWEAFYCFLIWPKLTRPVFLALAVLVHGGIAIALGMKTFGLAMLIGNIAFIYPEYVRATISWLGRCVPRLSAARTASAPADLPPRRQSFAATH